MTITKLVFCYLAIIAASITSSSASAFTIPVTLEGVRNDHGFYTTEDPIVMTVTVTNNSTERAFFHVTGEQTDLGYEKVFSPGIEPASFELEPGNSSTFTRPMDNRWEGPFLVAFTLEGKSLESNATYTGYANLRYQVHPPSDLFERENVETNRFIAYSTIAGAAASALIAFYAIRHEAKRSRQDKKLERYLKHSKTIGQAMVTCWIENRKPASWTYDRGIFQPVSISDPNGHYVTQTWGHFKTGYPNELRIYEKARDDTVAAIKEMTRLVKDFESSVVNRLVSNSGFVLNGREVDPRTVTTEEFRFLTLGKTLEALFKEALNRMQSEHSNSFKVGTETGGHIQNDYEPSRSYKYYPIEIPGWTITVGFCSDRESAKQISKFLNSIMQEKEIQDIVKSFHEQDSRIQEIEQKDLARFNQEVYTIRDAVMDDERLKGPGSCDLCKDDIKHLPSED
ncbi:MAG TPA: hypothetical protein VJP79_02165 [Nitrososphaera sp.]|nr:hypothetical protein [Nitrososphaera sp.]